LLKHKHNKRVREGRRALKEAKQEAPNKIKKPQAIEKGNYIYHK